MYSTQEKSQIGRSFTNYSFKRGEELSGHYMNCSFWLASMKDVKVRGAKFINCIFSHASINDSQFVDCKFIHCEFECATITDTFLLRSDFISCDFKWVKFREVSGLATCMFDASSKNLQGDFRPRGANFYLKGGEYRASAIFNSPNSSKQPVNVPEVKKEVKKEISPLPEVKHYRSQPKEESENSTAVEDDDYDVDYSWYMGGNMAGYTHWESYKDKWGYGDNAVLECSDIDIYKMHHE